MVSKQDIHPEELIERARDAELSAAERSLLDAHVAGCSACAFELAAIDDFASESAPQPGDTGVLQRVAVGVMDALDADTQLPEAEPSGALTRASRPVSVWVAVAAAVLLVLAGGAAAAYLVPKLLGQEEAETDRPAPIDRSGQVPRPAPEEQPADEASAEEDPVLLEPEVITSRRPTPARPKPPARPTDSDQDPLSAAELLARANAARGRGESRAAEQLYRTLQQQYPTSREQRVSRIALGRLLLDRLGNSRAGLAQFDYYLAHYPDGTLAEEARVGRALALGQLGGRARERTAWQDLLEHHPSSPHAGRARKRLDELDGPP